MLFIRLNNDDSYFDYPAHLQYLRDLQAKNFSEIEDDSVVWEPSMDIRETDDAYVINVDLPGIDRKDLKLSFEDNVLTIAGQKKSHHDDNVRAFHTERLFGHFKRTLLIPEKVNADEIKASYKDGVLTITIPKVESEVRDININ